LHLNVCHRFRLTQFLNEDDVYLLTKVEILHEVHPVQDNQHHRTAALVMASLSCLQINIRGAFSDSFAVSSNIQSFLWGKLSFYT
jgi:hypothetical protein